MARTCSARRKSVRAVGRLNDFCNASRWKHGTRRRCACGSRARTAAMRRQGMELLIFVGGKNKNGWRSVHASCALIGAICGRRMRHAPCAASGGARGSHMCGPQFVLRRAPLAHLSKQVSARNTKIRRIKKVLKTLARLARVSPRVPSPHGSRACAGKELHKRILSNKTARARARNQTNA